ncbi:hypothetical protein DF185_18290 [Marinifilum breve]|uniref:Uncharacterized protein n=1 Tax=Marinifilum breve TaxID=2184082 RepID=A0A2V3ZTF9_9BACT|nr:hypothetical protein [Marinifilum breve]PXX96977.1 hypothetical protein DF185_18290 [Marinifilum breve]
MSDKESFEALKPKYLLIEQDDVKDPNLPINIAVGEAFDLYRYATTDKDALTATDLDIATIEDLPIRAEGLREAQGNWIQVRKERSEAEEKWTTLSKEAFETRDELLHFCRYAYRKDNMAMQIVYHVAEGYTNTDMIQDLSELAKLIESKPEAFQAVGGDPAKATKAQTLAEECSLTLSSVNGDKAENDRPAKEMRDRAFTYLKQAVDAVRDAGRFVFWKNPEKAELYASVYFRELREERESKLQEEA